MVTFLKIRFETSARTLWVGVMGGSSKRIRPTASGKRLSEFVSFLDYAGGFFVAPSGTAGVARAWRFEFWAPVDRKSNDRNDIWVGDDVDHPLALPVGAHDAGQLELAQVMADGGEALARGGGQGPDVAVAVGELPQDVQSYRG
jgi:hypothetical protein